MKQRQAEKALGCMAMIWPDKADHSERRIKSPHDCDQKECSREKEYELEIGKGKVDTPPASHHQKWHSNNFLFVPTIDRDFRPSHPNNALAIEWERRVNADDQEPLGTIRNRENILPFQPKQNQLRGKWLYKAWTAEFGTKK